MSRPGYAVDAVDRGTDALPLLEAEDYDLLLSDIVMPEMDGIELAQRCAEISPQTRVITITGFAAVTLKGQPRGTASENAVEAVPSEGPLLEVERIFRGPGLPRPSSVPDGRVLAPDN